MKNDGVPSKIVVDGAREQIMGKFKEACQDATVQVQKLEYLSEETPTPPRT